MVFANGRRSSLYAMAGVAPLLIVLAGCSGAEGSTTTPELPDKNLDQWVMPLDEYRPTEMYFTVASAVSSAIVRACMVDSGEEYKVAIVDPESRGSETSTRYGRKLFSVAIASEWGYRPAPPPGSYEADRREAIEYSTTRGEASPSYADTLDACHKRADKEYPLAVTKYQGATSLAMDADAVALASEEVEAAAKRWRTCLTPKISFEVPRSPIDMPTEAMREKLGISGGDLTSMWSAGSTASSAEIETATEDAKCRRESGFSQAYYDASWDEQREQVRKHADELERARKAIQDDWADAVRRLHSGNATE